ncbi:TRAP transporter small permease [Chloroflexota bacterium]
MQRVARIIWEAPLSLQRVVMVLLALYLSFMVCFEVAVRYYVQEPILWVEELIIYVVFWFYFTGGIYATYKHSHIVGGVLHMFFKNKPRILGSFSILAALICLGLCCLFTYLSYNLFVYSLKVDPKTIHLMLHTSFARLSLLITFPLMAFYFLIDLVGSIRGVIRGTIASSAAGSTA